MNTQVGGSASDWTRTRVSSRLGIEYPIVQGPLGGFSSQHLTASVSNWGGLGSFGASGLAPADIGKIISEIRSLTSKPFAVNLWVSMEDEGAFSSGEEAFAKSLSVIAGHIREVGGSLPSYRPYKGVRFEDQARVLLDARVPVFSFIHGIPPAEILDECRAKKIVIVGTATAVEEALALEGAGVDLVVASGFEAGGHRGSFLRSSEDSLTGTLSLVPQIADAVDVPVVAAGGIGDARGIVAALALGAEGVQIGTAFLACLDSGASDQHRQSLLSGRAAQTALTRGFTGRLGRGIRNQLLEELNRPGTAILPYPLQRVLMRSLATAAERADRPELMPMWAGQSANLLRQTDAEALLHELVTDLEPIAETVTSWSASRPSRNRSR